MVVKVNGERLTDAEVAEELPFHQEAPQPWRSAVITLVLKRLVLAEAAERGLATDDAEAATAFLLSTQLHLPEVDEAACRRCYTQQVARAVARGQAAPPFEQVAGDIAQALRAANQDAAWRQYAQLLLGRARIEGIDLAGADTPLVQ
ncbi:MAG: hypothetical protein Q4D91_03075 [Lautropia sp.]|nr:hypothetical protein [Lautropia sp.]